MSDLFSLEDQVALVTGSSRGLGFAMAEALAAHGALVVLNGREAPTLERRAEELRGRGHRARLLPAIAAERHPGRPAVAAQREVRLASGQRHHQQREQRPRALVGERQHAVAVHHDAGDG